MKISKIILSLILGCAFAFSAFTFAACKVSGGEAAPSEQTPSGSNSGDTNNNGGNNNSQDGNKDDKTQEFSDILYTILTDKYYDDLRIESRDNGMVVHNNMKPIPYKFLRNRGHNVDAYLDGTLDAFASSYIYDSDKNHIYVSVKAENVSISQYGNYYTNYVLKYPLTDQEYDEYINLCEGGYLQGLLFIQELDNQKTPEMLSKVNIAKITYDTMVEEFPDLTINVNNYNEMDIDISFADLEKICISIRKKSNSNMMKNEIGFVDMRYKKLAHPNVYDDNAIYVAKPTSVNYDIDKYYSIIQNITSFGYGTNINTTNPYNLYEIKTALQFL